MRTAAAPPVPATCSPGTHPALSSPSPPPRWWWRGQRRRQRRAPRWWWSWWWWRRRGSWAWRPGRLRAVPAGLRQAPPPRWWWCWCRWAPWPQRCSPPPGSWRQGGSGRVRGARRASRGRRWVLLPQNGPAELLRQAAGAGAAASFAFKGDAAPLAPPAPAAKEAGAERALMEPLRLDKAAEITCSKHPLPPLSPAEPCPPAPRPTFP